MHTNYPVLTYNVGAGSAQSNFEVKALARTQALRNSLVVYLGAVSEFTGTSPSRSIAKRRIDHAVQKNLVSTWSCHHW